MLNSAVKLEIPVGVKWELLVIDNGSTDDTAAIIESFQDRLPIRGVMEPVPGLSNARNRGVFEANGSLILWTDDDVTVDRGWLTAYVEIAATFPQAGFFGGNITPILEEPVAGLFARNFEDTILRSVMAHRWFPEPSACIDNHTMPYGANFAVRGAIQKRYRFDPHLGVSPLQKRSCEETNMLLEAVADGIAGRTVPKSNVRHLIPPARQTRKYVRQYFAAIGETEAFVRTRPGYVVATTPLPHSNHHIKGMPVWLWREALKCLLKTWIARVSGCEADWLRYASKWEAHRSILLFVARNGRGNDVREASDPFLRTTA